MKRGVVKTIKFLKHQFKALDLVKKEHKVQVIGRDGEEKTGVKKFILMQTGYGGGKSWAGARICILMLMAFPGINIAAYSITFDILKLVSLVELEAGLIELGLKYSLNKQDMIITVPGYGRIILRSLDNPARIIGFTAGFSWVDEIDVLPKVKADTAWNMIIARNRQNIKGLTNKVLGTSTPEGFKFTYEQWGKNPTPYHQVVFAKSTDNPFLPDDYVDNLYAIYPPQLVEAYINGHWVNLTGGAVYHCFDRAKHHYTFDNEEEFGLQAVG